MARHQNDPAQSQSQPGATNPNPNEDVADGNQSTIQPGTGSGNTVGGQTTGDAATAGDSGDGGTGSGVSDGGNPAANQGGANGPAGR